MTEATPVPPQQAAPAAPVATPTPAPAPQGAPPPAEAKQPEPKPTPDSKRFAALQRKEKAARTAQEALAKREAELAEREARYKTYEERTAQAKLNPVAALESLGLSYDDLTTYLVNGNQPSPDAKVDHVAKEVERLRKEVQDREQKAVEAERSRLDASERQVEQEWADEVKQELSKDGTRFALVNKFGFTDFVIQEVKRRSQEAGELVNELEVADALEKQLRAEVQAAVQMDWAKAQASQVGEPTKQEAPPTASSRDRAAAQARALKKPEVKPTLSDSAFKPSSAGPSPKRTDAEKRAAAIQLLKEKRRAQ